MKHIFIEMHVPRDLESDDEPNHVNKSSKNETEGKSHEKNVVKESTSNNNLASIKSPRRVHYQVEWQPMKRRETGFPELDLEFLEKYKRYKTKAFCYIKLSLFVFICIIIILTFMWCI